MGYNFSRFEEIASTKRNNTLDAVNLANTFSVDFLSTKIQC